jgi:hypothetical protein
MKYLKAISELLCNSPVGEINGYSDEAQARKDMFARIGKKAMKELAQLLGLTTFKVSFNPAGIAVSGDLTLIGMFDDHVGIYVSINHEMTGLEVLYRTVRHMKDYSGGVNRWMYYRDLANEDKLFSTMGLLRNKAA